MIYAFDPKRLMISNLDRSLFRPAVTAVCVGADVVEPHVSRRLLGVRLEEDRLSVATPGTGVVI